MPDASIVDLAHRDNHGARLADFGKRVDVVQRVAAFRQVDQQDVRAGRDRKRLDGVAKAALVALFRLPTHVDDDRAQHVERGLVAQEGGKHVAVGTAGFPRSIHGPYPPD